MTGDAEQRIASLEDELHAMRNEQQALLSLNAIQRHHANVLRAALIKTRDLVEGIRQDWRLSDPSEIVRKTKNEARVIEATISQALALEDPPALSIE